MKCHVYRSCLKLDTYLYVLDQQAVNDLPSGLAKLLGQLEHVMQLDLATRTNLANADVEQVTASLELQGYYLQMPRKYHLQE